MELEDLLTQPTQGTQSTMDPRRMGRNNSGLAPSDVSDVMCILHPSTPAAFQLVIETARRSPQHILQDVYGYRNQHAASPSMLEEEETFILEGNSTNQALDLALRFSSRLHRPALGFVVGRNMGMCDIAVSSDVHKRVSNMHFSIYMNESGVLMLKDMSTNGTMVDEVLLKGRNHNGPKQRMLNHGSIVQILSPSPTEALKFIVRIPSRVDFMDEYEIKFSEYIERQVAAVRFDKQEGRAMAAPKFSPGQARLPNTAVKAPIVHNSYGMHWNGGETYNVVGQIGKGAFASVYQLATKADGQLFAAKELEKRKFMKNGVLDQKLENEMHIMQQIEHASIVQYHEYQDVANHLYIIMEYVPCGDLQQYLTEVGPLDEPVAKQMATQVFDALDYLHHKRITHRDIKPDNILIGSRDPNNFIIKLSDFGLSKVVKDNDTFLKTFCGTLLYCAPEVFPHYDAHVSGKGTKRPRKPPPQQSSKFHSYSQAVDIWSFGAVLWYSLCHRPPFEGVPGNAGRGMFDKIMMTPLDAADLVKQGVSDEAVALLVSMLNTDPAARPSAEDCLRHDWFGERFLGPKRESQPVLELEDIEEDVEAEAGADRDEEEGTEHPDVAALSLVERGIGSGNSDLSINSSDMNFFDPRKSKRFKTNEMDQREEEENFLDSSPELLYDSIPIVHQPETEQRTQATADRLKPSKLFGEISQSDLQGPAFNMRANDAVGNTSSSIQSDHARTSNRSQQSAQQGSSDEFGASPSLFGAESMVRDMNMDSVNDSDDDDAEEPATPESEHSFGELSHHDPSQHSPGSADIDPTPRPPQPAVFNRQIHIPVPPSFYFDPADQSTHTLEYASKASGRDFAAEFKTQANGSAESTEELTTQSLPGSAETSRILGRLVSTSDSFERIVLDMKSRDMSWGRSPGNTYIYQKELDTRIPRTAVLTFFYADGIKDVPEGEDITQLPGLYTGILTHGSNGLRVNGVQLDAGPEGKYLYGQLHTGDVIEVFPGTKDGKRGLWFRAEIYHGKGKTPRPKDGPRFKVEQQKQPKQEKQPRKKEKKADVENAEKENHAEEVR
ncbi:hypothetical protein M409DRAFT_64846 [Zasmidium cellare ATCC 36951]|uniref:Pkinase-domain-containing protein n=1 Tax=Zasmidium cellare ATCC 36951 TaxID=1080233 RepID=A0A6A6CS04_ZASCE|nr:uncharacterized protein M409DRAFT_64846 [Zasmidium cellare ATCC 36951]KAF2169855.1 hypothetical protein M409DRAFT_64846 [Zasmidium cellare ATCC 36951]